MFLLDVDEDRGFQVHAPAGLDEALRKVFDPEDEGQKLARAQRLLATAIELKAPGGFMLVKDIAETANVSLEVCRKAVTAYLADNPGVELLAVDGTPVVRRQRF